MKRRWVLLALALLYLLVRYQNTPGVLTERGLVLNDTDPYYRLHRIVSMVQGSLAYPFFDSSLSYPRGFEVPWPTGLDLTLAIPMKILGVRERSTIETVCALAIPLLSLPALFFTFLAVSAVAGTAAGWAAGFLLALSPAAINAGAVGRLDHHFLEILFTSLTFWLLALLRGPSGRRAWLGLWAVLGLAPSFWPQAWVLGLFAAGSFLIDPLPGLKPKSTRLFLASSLLSLVPLAFTHRFVSGWLTPFGFSWWTPLLYAALALGFSLLVWPPLRDRSARRWVGTCVLYLAASAAFVAWRNGVSIFSGSIAQSVSALAPHGGTMATTSETIPTLLIPAAQWPRLGLVWLPFAWLWLLLQAFRKDRWWIVGFITGPLVLSALQARFVPLATPVLIAGSVFLILDLVRRFRSAWVPSAVLGTVAVALSIPAAPRLSWTAGGNTHPFFEPVREAAEFLRSRPPGPIAAHWDFGDWLLYWTGMPVIAHPFQDRPAFDTVALLVSENASDLDAYVKEYAPRYLIVERPSDRLEQWLLLAGKNPADYVERPRENEPEVRVKERFFSLLSPRFFLKSGADPSGRLPPDWRLIFTGSRGYYGSDKTPTIRVFERVPDSRFVDPGNPR